MTAGPPRRFRRGLAVAALLGALGLLALEGRELLTGGPRGASWFWIVVAVTLAMLSLAELLDRPPGDTPE